MHSFETVAYGVNRERIELEKKQKEKAKKDAESQRKEQAEREKEEAAAEAKRLEKLNAQRMVQSISVDVKISKESSVSVSDSEGGIIQLLRSISNVPEMDFSLRYFRYSFRKCFWIYKMKEKTKTMISMISM